MQARRIRPDTGPTDRRRLAAAGLSAVLPGLGQAFNRRRRLALWFLIPSLLVLVVTLIVVKMQTPAHLAAWAIAPAVLGTLLLLNVVLLAWRLGAVGQAFLDTRRQGPTGKLGVIGLAVIVVVVIAPHALAWQYGGILRDTFGKVFSGQELAAAADGGPRDARPGPGGTERINILLIGVDATSTRTTELTDTMMVASLDPVGHTVSMISIPRDLVNVPLGNGDTYGPKLNSLLSYADRHKELFPNGGIAALEDAVGELLQIPIHYYARIDFVGFIGMVDAVGGVDIDVAKGFSDPNYDGFGLPGGKRGFSVTAGKHHFSGAEALAYARVRKAPGESDFTRAARQQEVIAALRDRVLRGGSVLWELPKLLDSVGDTVRSDVPIDRLPDLAAVMDEMGRGSMVRAVIKWPLVHPISTKFGASQDPDIPAIRAMAAKLFSAPGVAPIPWPTPRPTPTPKPTKAPKATPTADS